MIYAERRERPTAIEEEVENSMFCRDCGAQVLEGAKFCEGCGAQMAAAAQADRPEGRRSSRRRLAALALVVLLGAAAAWIYVARQKPPRGAASVVAQPGVLSEPPANAKLGDVFISPKDRAEMVYVPAGEFIMGSSDSSKDARTEEKPQFRASLSGYWIDKCEVTVTRYRRFCQETGREMPLAPPWGWQDDYPVVNITWHDAASYAEWAGKRLPTEMEWEKAARGTDGREYPWGNSWEAGKCATSRHATQPVGSLPGGASPCGALDMAGNVREWCADWYDNRAYQRYAGGDLKPPASGNGRELRGGSWYDDLPTRFRCAHRDNDLYSVPENRFSDVGFRCVRGMEGAQVSTNAGQPPGKGLSKERSETMPEVPQTVRLVASDGDALDTLDDPVSDFTLTYDVDVKHREGSVWFRLSSGSHPDAFGGTKQGSNGYGLVFCPHSDVNPGLFLIKREGGVEHAMSETNRGFPRTNGRATFTLTARGSHIEVREQGRVILSAEDGSFRSGRLAWRVYGVPSSPGEATFRRLEYSRQ